MKKIITLLMLVGLTSLTHATFAQQKSDEYIISSDKIIFDKEPQFECKQIAYNDKTKIMTLQNVSLKTDKFEFINAGKVVYNENTKKLTIYNCKGFTIDGKVVIQTDKKRKNVVEYTIGEDVAYLL
jgi:lipopolysaccharide assembly outer membrane protein LptD (OstA)